MRSLLRRYPDAPWGIAMVAPFLVLLAAFTLYPILTSLTLSFQEFSYLSPETARFVGLDQYAQLFDDQTFRTALVNTLALLLAVLPAQTLLALLLANILNARLRASGFFRTIYFMPYIAPSVAVAAVMIYLFSRDGIVSGLLHGLLGTGAVAWYADPGYAFWLVAMVMVWTQVGFFTILFLAGLQNIPVDVYEAAALDGAGPVRTLRSITLPLLRPTTFLVVVIGITITLQVFEQPYVISTTGGALAGSPADATLTLVMYLYTQAFRYFHMGLASATALVVLVLVGVFALLQAFLQRGGRDA